jgi:hypothetical protein
MRRDLAERLAEALKPLLRGTDVVMVPSQSDTVHLLLVDAGIDSVPVLVARFASELLQQTLDDSGAGITFQVGVGSFPHTAATPEELRAQAVAIAEGAMKDQVDGRRYELRFPAADDAERTE